MKPSEADYRTLRQQTNRIQDDSTNVEQAGDWAREALPFLKTTDRKSLIRYAVLNSRDDILNELYPVRKYMSPCFSVDRLIFNALNEPNWSALRTIRDYQDLFAPIMDEPDEGTWETIAGLCYRYDRVDVETLFREFYPDSDVPTVDYEKIVGYVIREKDVSDVKEFMDEHSLTIQRDHIKTALRMSRTDVAEWMLDAWAGNETNDVITELSKAVRRCDEAVQDWFVGRLDNEHRLTVAQKLSYEGKEPADAYDEPGQYEYLHKLLDAMPTEQRMALFETFAHERKGAGCELVLRYLQREAGGPTDSEWAAMTGALIERGRPMRDVERYYQSGFSLRQYRDHPDAADCQKTMGWVAEHTFEQLDYILQNDRLNDQELTRLLEALGGKVSGLRPIRFILDRFHVPDDPTGMIEKSVKLGRTDNMRELVERFSHHDLTDVYEPLLQSQTGHDTSTLNEKFLILIENDQLPDSTFFERYDEENWSTDVFRSLAERNVLPSADYVTALKSRDQEAYDRLMNSIEPKLTKRQRQGLKNEERQAKTQDSSG